MKRGNYLLLVVGFGLIGLIKYVGSTISREVTAVRHIKQTGGYVAFSHYGPEWIVKFFGNAYPCKSVREVGMGYRTSDGDLSFITSLKQVRVVMLNATDVKGPGLARLKVLPKLESLDLTRSAITDEGLAYLDKLKTLKMLGLAGTGITDQGVIRLRQQSDLQELDLAETKVTDLSFQCLSRFRLKWLNVRGTLMTPSGIASFQRQNPSVHIIQ